MRLRHTEDYRQHNTLDQFGHYERLVGQYPRLQLEMRAQRGGGLRIGFVSGGEFVDGFEAADRGYMASVDALILQCLNNAESPISAAARLVDVNLAFAHVQDHGFIRSTDAVSVFASGVWGAEHLDLGTYWISLSKEDRQALLLTYLTFESLQLGTEERFRYKRADAEIKGHVSGEQCELV
ncbi:hypothetical protein [Paracidovorax citrulli]